MKKKTHIFHPYQTSARFLVNYAKSEFQKDNNNEMTGKYAIIYDLYIKAKSYAIINKIFFICSMIFALMVLLWPSISVISKDFDISIHFLESAIVQTTITGIAALSFSIYSHYKKKQMYTENLIRFAVFSKLNQETLALKIMNEISKMDYGFSFKKGLTESYPPTDYSENNI